MNLELTQFGIIRFQQLYKFRKKQHTRKNTNSFNNDFKYGFNQLYYDCKHLIFWLFQFLSGVGSAWYNQRHVSGSMIFLY